ncbi:hypothetical protein EXU57_23045 [Segetibacter sp. 3557_3]|uniref:hypothetical protein n=1 Tax=Segetibacter sp. 3557_3 TaxID=2547429 RepID=UPI0010585650|nr:hypothetical protein [Segetibacter sp. 3557_3]TDH18480.1 hypothetical protein EXU57_23045 [Segetibacter sp. 3557_3]
MYTKILLLVVFSLVLSAALASYKGVIVESVYFDELAYAKAPAKNWGIKDELRDKNLMSVLANIVKLKKGKIGEIIHNFQNTSRFKWIIREGALPDNVNAQIQATSEGASTIVDLEKFQDGTDLSVARTIIHEMVHAYLTLYFLYDHTHAKIDYPGIYSAWSSSMDPDYNKIQHDEIERSLMDDIAIALAEYSAITGLLLMDDYVYKDLAWGGLDYISRSDLTPDMKERIYNRLMAEQLNKRSKTEIPVGFR